MAKDRDEKGWFVQGNEVSKITKKKLDSLVDEYCIHLANGYSKNSFASCHWRTIERGASVFHSEKIRAAESAGLALYERIIQNAAFGLVTKVKNQPDITPDTVNPTLLIFQMKNKMRGFDQREAKELEKEKESDKPGDTDTNRLTLYDPNSEQSLDLSNIGAANEKTT